MIETQSRAEATVNAEKIDDKVASLWGMITRILFLEEALHCPPSEGMS